MEVALGWDTQNPLGRVIGEPRQAARALTEYYLLGANRTIDRLHAKYAEQLVQDPTSDVPHVSLRALRDWSLRYQWKERIEQQELLLAEADLREFHELRKVLRRRRQAAIIEFFEKTLVGVQLYTPKPTSPQAAAKALALALDQMRIEFQDNVPNQLTIDGTLRTELAGNLTHDGEIKFDVSGLPAEILRAISECGESQQAGGEGS